jgi:hypothetical protein
MNKPHITDLYFHNELSMTVGVDAANTWFAGLSRRSFSRKISSQRFDDGRPSSIATHRFSLSRPSSKTSSPSPATNPQPMEGLDIKHLVGESLSEAVIDVSKTLHHAKISNQVTDHAQNSIGRPVPNEDSDSGLMFTDAAHTVFDRTDQGRSPTSEN